jgi:hypothetical protein
MQIITGYKGTAEIRLAIDANEVAGLCGLAWASIKVTWRKQLDSGEVKVILQNTAAPHPELPDVPLAINFAKTAAGRKLIQLVSTMSGQLPISIRFLRAPRRTECTFSVRLFTRL